MPQDDYDALLDKLDAAELRIARLINENDEGMPHEIMVPLIDGENPVRVFRKWRGLTVSQLAERAGISQPYLSGIEKGQRDGTLKTLVAIAEALDVDLDELAGWLLREPD